MCETRGVPKPLPQITWYKDDKRVRNSRHFYIIVSIVYNDNKSLAGKHEIVHHPLKHSHIAFAFQSLASSIYENIFKSY